MNTKVIVETPLITLHANNADGENHSVELYANDFRTAEVGKTWKAYVGACYRATNETLEVVYKTSTGVALLYRSFGYDNAEEWEDAPELWWVEFKEVIVHGKI